METTNPETQKNSKLIPVLREGVSIIQMILFKELRTHLSLKYVDMETTFHSMLTGAIINELFGIHNPEEKFQHFRQENLGTIEQELLSFSAELPKLRPILTDALRIQTLCDHQEGSDNSSLLIAAEDMGILVTDRDLPLPSIFMTRIRTLGEEHGLTLAPVQVSPEDDNSMVQ